jgi:TRAP-type uncharacterized transport system fused permease subunit
LVGLESKIIHFENVEKEKKSNEKKKVRPIIIISFEVFQICYASQLKMTRVLRQGVIRVSFVFRVKGKLLQNRSIHFYFFSKTKKEIC